MIVSQPHIAESAHWYGRDGSVAYEVVGNNGSKRPTTLRDARKLGLVPSVTTVIKCASAPALERWKQNQVMLAAMTLPRKDNESDADFCQRVMRDSGEQARNAAERGTKIHAAIQGHFEGEPPSAEHFDCVQLVAETLRQNCTSTDWTPERSFAHQLGFGGKCDLSSLDWVIDFKTKEFRKDAIAELKTWDDHAMQLAAYREGLGLSGARCGIVYVSTVEPLCRLIEIDEEDLRKGWLMFTSLLQFWKARAGYYPEHHDLPKSQAA
jgi:hypothetical protein